MTNKSSTYFKNSMLIFSAIVFYFFMLNISHVWSFAKYLLNIISPFIVGGAIAFIIKIPMNFFENVVFKNIKNPKLQKLKRPLSLLISLLIAGLIISFIIVLIIPQLIESATALKSKLPIFIDNLLSIMKNNKYLEEYAISFEKQYSNFSWDSLFDNIKQIIIKKDSTIVSQGINITSSLANSMTNSVLAFVFSIYILLDKERIKRQSQRLLHSILNEKKANYIIHIFRLADYYFHSFIKGQILDAFIIGLMTFFGMLLLKLPYAAMIATFVGFMDLIPIIGPIIGAGIGFVFILIESPSSAFIFLIMMLVFQQIQGNIIYPKIVGDSLGLPAMWSLFGIVIGGSLFGIVGMWIFVPLLAVVYTLLGEYISRKLEEKNLNSIIK